MDNELNKLFSGLLTEYYKLNPEMPRILVDIIISNDLFNEHLKLRPDVKDKLVSSGFERERHFNGILVTPREVGDTIHIVLNRERIIEYTKDGSMTWIGTLAHELTHAIDYYQMALKENLASYDFLLETKDYLMFHLWSEYHARKLGYSFLRNCLKADLNDNDREQRINYILDEEIPFHINKFYKDYHYDNNGNNQLYLTMQLIGRFSVWCDLFPEVFTELKLKQIFKNCLWMYSTLIFLKQNETLEKIYYNFDNMRLTLKENWRSL